MAIDQGLEDLPLHGQSELPASVETRLFVHRECRLLARHCRPHCAQQDLCLVWLFNKIGGPSFIASMATGTSAWPVMTITGQLIPRFLSLPQELKATDVRHSHIGDDAIGFGGKDGIKENLERIRRRGPRSRQWSAKMRGRPAQHRRRLPHGPHVHWALLSSSGATPRSVMRKIVPPP